MVNAYHWNFSGVHDIPLYVHMTALTVGFITQKPTNRLYNEERWNKPMGVLLKNMRRMLGFISVIPAAFIFTANSDLVSVL